MIGPKSYQEEVIKNFPQLKEFFPFIDQLNEESRGKVLISTGFLEELLKRILVAFMREETPARFLEGGYAPLGSFSARENACYALGLITANEWNDLTLIRGIRNDFAHEIHTSFETPTVITRCTQLKASLKDPEATPSALFTSAVVMLVLKLAVRPDLVNKERRTEVDWAAKGNFPEPKYSKTLV